VPLDLICSSFIYKKRKGLGIVWLGVFVLLDMVELKKGKQTNIGCSTTYSTENQLFWHFSSLCEKKRKRERIQKEKEKELLCIICWSEHILFKLPLIRIDSNYKQYLQK
jgi:hypothetical protein